MKRPQIDRTASGFFSRKLTETTGVVSPVVVAAFTLPTTDGRTALIKDPVTFS